MKINIINELEKDVKLHEYLYERSNWYRLINRDSKYFENFKKEYKNYKRSQDLNKINTTIENIEMISDIVKFMN